MPLFKAQRYVRAVELIDVRELRDLGIRCVLLDRDNTLVPRDTKQAPSQVRAWLEELREAGVAICMVSNNFHTAAVCDSAHDLGVEVVHHAMKPFPVAVWVAMEYMGVPAQQTVMIGDQLFTDMLAANLAGVHSILVRPQSVTDLWYTNILRRIERPLLRSVTFEGE